MSNLESIRTQRAQTESEFQTAFKSLFGDSRASHHEQTITLALHREICALYAAELSLITSGKLPNEEPSTKHKEPLPSFYIPPFAFATRANTTTEPVPPLPRQDAARLSLLPRLLARVTRRLQNRPLDDSGTSTP